MHSLLYFSLFSFVSSGSFDPVACSGNGNAQIHVNNRIGLEIVAPIQRANGSPPLPGATVQVMLVQPDGSLVPILPTTHFRIEGPPAGHCFFWPITPVVPGVLPCEEATFRVRAWEGADWDSATARGESTDVTVRVGGSAVVPPNLPMSGFTLFPRVTLTLPLPEPAAWTAQVVGLQAFLSNVDEGVEVAVQESHDLREWQTILVTSAVGPSISFDVFASEECRFYRVMRL